MSEIRIESGLLADLPEERVDGRIYVALDNVPSGPAMYIDTKYNGTVYRFRITNFPNDTFRLEESEFADDDFKGLFEIGDASSQATSLKKAKLPSVLQKRNRQALLSSIFKNELTVDNVTYSGNLSLYQGVIDDSGEFTQDLTANTLVTDFIPIPSDELIYISLYNNDCAFRVFNYIFDEDENATFVNKTDLNSFDGFVCALSDQDTRIRIVVEPTDDGSLNATQIRSNLRLYTNITDVEIDTTDLKNRFIELEDEVETLTNKVSMLENGIDIAHNYAEMATNISKVYLYAGDLDSTSVSGITFTPGFIYYYDNNGWHQGGEYGVADESLVPRIEALEALGLVADGGVISTTWKGENEEISFQIAPEYFSLGGITAPTIYSRIHTDKVITTNEGLTINVDDGYLAYIYYYVNGERSTGSGWKTTINVAADKSFKLIIAPKSGNSASSSTTPADIDTLATKATITGCVGDVGIYEYIEDQLPKHIKNPLLLDKTGQEIVKAIQNLTPANERLYAIEKILTNPAEYITKFGEATITYHPTAELLSITNPNSGQITSSTVTVSGAKLIFKGA